jgi:collagenase-like PrtC family protease
LKPKVKLSVGYQLADADEESFAELIAPHTEEIEEVYFAWPGHASGRSPVGVRDGVLDKEAFGRFEADLTRLRNMGLKLDVLFNANCYGGDAMSVALEREVTAVLRHLAGTAGGADIVTTTSPAVAWIVKRRWPAAEVRASVNMRVGTVAGMTCLARLFDSFCVQREVNRDLGRLHELRAWADSTGKRLHLLANSGCLRHCPGQTFHDNLVAHETEAARTEKLPSFIPYVCWVHLRDRSHWPAVLQATWVRPEDIARYDRLVDGVKLATRLHARPHSVIGAYARRRWAGNLLDLLEPGFSPLFAPWVIDNSRFPANWFDHAAACGGVPDCPSCREILDRVLVRLDVP